jgi:hypothetical protein
MEANVQTQAETESQKPQLESKGLESEEVSPEAVSLQRESESPSPGDDDENLPIGGAIQRQEELSDSEDEEMKPVQAKLTIGAPGDKYEQEADTVAAQVMSMPEGSHHQPIQRQSEEDASIQMQPLVASITPLVQRVEMPLIQRAWTGRRQLGAGGLNKVLGKPSVWRTKGNLLRWGGYHEHIFFEDGNAPPDIGHMGKQGLGQDTGRQNEYSKVRTGLDDSRMREAVAQVKVNAGEYSLLSNNCQKYVASVLRIYDQSQEKSQN